MPKASNSPKDPYAENAPKTKEEEQYYQDVYSGDWREQLGPFGFGTSIGKKSGSSTMPSHWAMKPHGAKTIREMNHEKDLRATEQLALRNDPNVTYGGVPVYQPVSAAPGAYTVPPWQQPPYPSAQNQSAQNQSAPYQQLPNAGNIPVQNAPYSVPSANAPYYANPTYNGQGQYIPAVVERPVAATGTQVPQYNTIPQNMQNPAYTQPGSVQTPAAPQTIPDRLQPIQFPTESNPNTGRQTTPVPSSGVNSAPVNNAPVNNTPASNAPVNNIPASNAPVNNAPVPGQMSTPYPQFGGFLQTPVTDNRAGAATESELADSPVFFSSGLIIRGQVPAVKPLGDARADEPEKTGVKAGGRRHVRKPTVKPTMKTTVKPTANPVVKPAGGTEPVKVAQADLFESDAAAPAAVRKSAPRSTTVPAMVAPRSEPVASGTAPRVGRVQPLKIDETISDQWRGLDDPLKRRTWTDGGKPTGEAVAFAFSGGSDSARVDGVYPNAGNASKYGREGKIKPGYSPYEYPMDGGDSKVPAYATPDWVVHHLDSEDTIAHFDTLDGQILVEPSNRVSIYSPRFGSVRQIVGVNEGDQNITLHKAETKQGAVQDEKTARADVRSQEQTADLTRTNLNASGLVARDIGHIVNAEVNAMEVSQEIVLADIIGLAKAESMTDADHARMLAGSVAAQAWGGTNAVRVVIGETFAASNVYGKTPEVLYQVKNGTKTSKLRLIKVASKDAAQPGEVVEFVLRYENVGDQVIGNVTILDSLSPRLTYVARSAKSSRDAKFITNDNEQGSLVLRWEITDPIKPGEFGVIEFMCKVL